MAVSQSKWKQYEELSIKLTTAYLKKFPDKASKYCKTKDKQEENIRRSFSKKIAPNEPTTVPDELVADVLELVFKHDKSERRKVQTQYNNQKQAEMIIGQLLELYIAENGMKYGWVFSGECITAVDLLRKDGVNEWTTLQIKNSDNTENSSAKTVRDGTTILKWNRRKSTKGTQFWDKFPDEKLKQELSEEGFWKYIKAHFK